MVAINWRDRLSVLSPGDGSRPPIVKHRSEHSGQKQNCQQERFGEGALPITLLSVVVASRSLVLLHIWRRSPLYERRHSGSMP
jgi:hypothetical protein